MQKTTQMLNVQTEEFFTRLSHLCNSTWIEGRTLPGTGSLMDVAEANVVTSSPALAEGWEPLAFLPSDGSLELMVLPSSLAWGKVQNPGPEVRVKLAVMNGSRHPFLVFLCPHPLPQFENPPLLSVQRLWPQSWTWVTIHWLACGCQARFLQH